VAYLIDLVILFAAQVAIFIVLVVAGAALDAAISSGSLDRSLSGFGSTLAGVFGWAISVAGQWLYFSLQESSERQATPGKRVMGIKVVDLAGRRISFGRATGRYFAKILSGLICDIGFILAGFTERKQALHDLIASTLVVRANPIHPQALQARGSSNAMPAVLASVLAAAAVLVLTSIVVLVILLTMGGQIRNVFSNVVVALNS
jgi:uncharacterized RDD family membrane protein YckC